jgi:hypothetical protein
MIRTITLQGYFDGKQIRLDEPFEMEANTPLIIIVLPKELADDERQFWLPLSIDGLANAYGDKEPSYSIHLIKERNPEYEGGWSL